jgi:carbamoyltransferase
MTYILGINELLHDTSAVLIKDGKLLGAIEEERLSKKKHALGLCLMGEPPTLSINWCLDYFGVKESDIDCVALSFDVNYPILMRMLYYVFTESIQKMSLKNIFKKKFSEGDPGMNLIPGSTYGYFIPRKKFLADLKRRFKRVVPVKHHVAHAYSTYFMSGFDEANIFVTDGLGDESPSTTFNAKGDKIDVIKSYTPHQSLGTLYRTISQICGFVYFDAGKTMGLSAYGEYKPEYGKYLIPGDGGDYRINFRELKNLDCHTRTDKDAITKTHKDIAATLQRLLEETALKIIKSMYEKTGCKKLCLSGGVTLNCVMNSILLQSEYVDDIFIQPAAMDMGASLGAAIYAYIHSGGKWNDVQRNMYLGPEYSDDEIEPVLKKSGLQYKKYEEVEKEAAKLLMDKKILGWFQGRMEFGPRALGARSILGNPTDPTMKDKVNNIKGRELWRPLAPVVLEEEAHKWFEDYYPTPYMTLNFQYKKDKVHLVPSVVHVDGSARVQSADKNADKRYRKLIEEFYKLSNIPILLNTSYNRRKEPIVCKPEDALDCFVGTKLDYLCIGSFIVSKP